MDYNFQRFLKAQESEYEIALSEIKSGRKRSHWMWYIFPQFRGLGLSSISEKYAINNLGEAKAYLCHPILGERLKAISNELLNLNQTDARLIFGRPDDLKLKSSMTLFYLADRTNGDIFLKVLEKFYNGQMDKKTQHLLIK